MSVRADIKLFGDTIKNSLSVFVNLELKKIAPLMIEDIYKRTKSRKGITGIGEQAKEKELNELSDSYVAYRQKLYRGELGKQKAPKQGFFESNKKYKSRSSKERRSAALKSFGDYFSPKRSNLTLTGQMLDSLNFRITKGRISIFVDDSPRDDGEKNSDIAEYVTKQGRPFLGLTDKQQLKFFRQVETDLRKYLRAALK